MADLPEWTNPSVLAFADGGDPPERASTATRQLLEAAVAQGMTAPPVDPLALAKMLGLGVAPRNDIADASIAEDPRDRGTRESGEAPLRGLIRSNVPLLIAYNPNRPRGRLRFSIAHEIAHALFPDVAETVRHRTPADAVADVSATDEWELELLCNVVAAELLLPPEAVDGLLDIDTDIDIMETRRRWDVSTEALLRRLVSASRRPLTLIAASRLTSRDPRPLRVDYQVWHPGAQAAGPAAAPVPSLHRGELFDTPGPFTACVAVGQTARGSITIGEREWPAQTVGIPGYPGQLFPRVLGLAEPLGGQASPQIRHVQSDLLDFGDGSDPVVVAHVGHITGARLTGAVQGAIPWATGRRYSHLSGVHVHICH